MSRKYKPFIIEFSLIYEVRTHIRTIVDLLESNRLVSDFANQFPFVSRVSEVEREERMYALEMRFS